MLRVLLALSFILVFRVNGSKTPSNKGDRILRTHFEEVQK